MLQLVENAATHVHLHVQEVNVVHCNAAINSCILCWLQAAELLGTWCSRGRMDVISCNTMTTALEKGSLWQAARQLLSQVGLDFDWLGCWSYHCSTKLSPFLGEYPPIKSESCDPEETFPISQNMG